MGETMPRDTQRRDGKTAKLRGVGSERLFQSFMAGAVGCQAEGFGFDNRTLR